MRALLFSLTTSSIIPTLSITVSKRVEVIFPFHSFPSIFP